MQPGNLVMEDKRSTIEVRVAIPPSLAKMFNVEEINWFDQIEAFRDGASVGDLLDYLALAFPKFKSVLFDPQGDNISGRIDIFLNGNLLMLPNARQVKLNDKDLIVFLPAYFGR
jgi:hypothetical protein